MEPTLRVGRHLTSRSQSITNPSSTLLSSRPFVSLTRGRPKPVPSAKRVYTVTTWSTGCTSQ